LLGFFLLLAYGMKRHLTDPSYYRFGYYRADAVTELTEGPIRYLGSPYCMDECHEDRKADWPLSAHKAVQCEVCHGPAPEHPDDGRVLAPTDTIRLCTTCHESMPARPVQQPQIVSAEHPFDDGQVMPCIECHDPHAPGPVLREEPAVAVAQVVPEVAAKCAKCHGKLGEGVRNNPPLAGLDSVVFTARMEAYRSGDSDNKIMIRFAQALSEEEIAELAAYYASLPGGTSQ
jgi:cytochrome c553